MNRPRRAVPALIFAGIVAASPLLVIQGAYAASSTTQRVTTNSGHTTTVVPPPSQNNPTLPFTPNNPAPVYVPPSQLPYTPTGTSSLPFTGIDIAEMAGIGAGAIAAGAAVLTVRRRRTV